MSELFSDSSRLVSEGANKKGRVGGQWVKRKAPERALCLVLFDALVSGVNTNSGNACNDEDNHSISHDSHSRKCFSTAQVNVNGNERIEKKQSKVVRRHFLRNPTSQISLP